MSPLASDYSATVTRLIKRLCDVNAPVLGALAPLIGRSVAEGGVVHTFGSGHSDVIAREIVGRAGGLVCVSSVEDPTAGHAENIVGYGTRIAERHDNRYGLRPGETIIVISNSGKNCSPIEVALYAKQKGLTVAALTCLAMSREAKTVHPGGRNLHLIADHVLDNCGVPGDATQEVGDGVRAGPTSTIAGALLLNLLFLEVVDWLKANGHTPPLLRSQNIPGAIEQNRALARRYAGRLSKPLA